MELPLISLSAERFFAVLPADWRAQIEPFWADYENQTTVLGFEENGQVIAGGLVFTTPAPDTAPYAQEAQAWFNKGYLYIGFLWVDPAHRDQGHGTRWVRQVLARYPDKPFWIAIEEAALGVFYEKLGFVFVKQVVGPYGEESIYTLETHE